MYFTFCYIIICRYVRICPFYVMHGACVYRVSTVIATTALVTFCMSPTFHCTYISAYTFVFASIWSIVSHECSRPCLPLLGLQACQVEPSHWSVPHQCCTALCIHWWTHIRTYIRTYAGQQSQWVCISSHLSVWTCNVLFMVVCSSSLVLRLLLYVYGYTVLWYKLEDWWKSCLSFNCNALVFFWAECYGRNIGRIFLHLQAGTRELCVRHAPASEKPPLPLHTYMLTLYLLLLSSRHPPCY